MPIPPAGADPEKASGAAAPKPPGKVSSPGISNEALAALEKHFGVSSPSEAQKNESESVSATGFAAMLAQGSMVGSSGSLPAIGGASEASRRDAGEIPEAKIIELRPDGTMADQKTDRENERESESGEVDSAPLQLDDAPTNQPIVYATTQVDDAADEPSSKPISRSPAVSAPPRSGTRPRSAGMPEHYKALIPLLIAFGILSIVISVWAIAWLTGAHVPFAQQSASRRPDAQMKLFCQVATIGLPLGLTMLGLTAYIFTRYRKKV